MVLARSTSPHPRPHPCPRSHSTNPHLPGDPAVIAKQAGRGGSRGCAARTALGSIWQSEPGTGHEVGLWARPGAPSPCVPSAPAPCTAPATALRALRDPGRGRGWLGPEPLPSAWHSMGGLGGRGSGWSHIRAAPSEPLGVHRAALEGNALTPMCCTLGFALLLFLFDFSGPVSFFRLFLL